MCLSSFHDSLPGCFGGDEELVLARAGQLRHHRADATGACPMAGTHVSDATSMFKSRDGLCATRWLMRELFVRKSGWSNEKM